MKISMLEHWKNTKASRGFRVHFEQQRNSVLASDHMPDDDETPIPTLEVAWEIARQMDDCAPKSIVNIYVVDLDWKPVAGYMGKLLRKYPAR